MKRRQRGDFPLPTVIGAWILAITSTLTLAPRMYTFLFLVGLAVMYFFSITLVAGSAAVVLFGASALYGAFAK